MLAAAESRAERAFDKGLHCLSLYLIHSKVPLRPRYGSFQVTCQECSCHLGTVRRPAVGVETRTRADQHAGAQKPKSKDHDDETANTKQSSIVVSAAISASCSVGEGFGRLTSNRQNCAPFADSRCPLHPYKHVSVNGRDYMHCEQR